MNTVNFSAVHGPTIAVAAAITQALQLDRDLSATWVTTSQLVLQGQAIKHEIEVHKWCESEKAGHDIGWEAASASWHMHLGHLPGLELPPHTEPAVLAAT